MILCKSTDFSPLTLPPQPYYVFLGAFAKLRKETISFIMSVLPSAWNILALTGRMFMKFDI